MTLAQLSALIDDGILQDLRPDFHDELVEEQEMYLENLPRLRATIDLFRLDVTDVGVDGVLWWGYADDEPDEEDGAACDRGELRADALTLHVLTRTRPSERVDFLSPWRSSTLADAARVVVPLTRDLKVTQPDDIEAIVTLLQQLGTAVERDRLRLNQVAIPKNKYEYVKPGWPELPRMTSVSVLAA